MLTGGWPGCDRLQLFSMLPCTTSDALHVFFFNAPATTEIYTLSLHDALPISSARPYRGLSSAHRRAVSAADRLSDARDRKSTRLNSSHRCISYAVFCLKKKKKKNEKQSQ